MRPSPPGRPTRGVRAAPSATCRPLPTRAPASRSTTPTARRAGSFSAAPALHRRSSRPFTRLLRTVGTPANVYAHASSLFDVTSGTNGTCSPSYLCTAGPGYDGPTGLGTRTEPAASNPAPACQDLLGPGSTRLWELNGPRIRRRIASHDQWPSRRVVLWESRTRTRTSGAATCRYPDSSEVGAGVCSRSRRCSLSSR